MRTAAFDEPYFTILRYRGSDGIVVELEFERSSNRVRVGRWWWRFEGCTEWMGGAGHKQKMAALLEAAHARGMSGEQFDAKPVLLRSVR